MGHSVDHDRMERLLGAVHRAIGDADAGERLTRDPGGWLGSVGLSPADVECFAGLGARRLLLYRKLVRRGLVGAIRIEIPRTAARLEGDFDVWTSRFLDEDLPRSHYLRDVAFAFVDWAAPRWAEDARVPAYFADLARHEFSAFDVAAAEPEARGLSGHELALDRSVRLDRAARVLSYAHAVHRLHEDLAARDVPTACAVTLLAYRDRELDVRYLELTPLAGAIVSHLAGGRALGEAITAACAGLGVAVDASVIEGSATVLADLADRGVLLGAEPLATKDGSA